MDIVLENQRLIFKLPFRYKDKIKALGAKWNSPVVKHWSMPLSSVNDSLIEFIETENLKISNDLADKINNITAKRNAAHVKLAALKDQLKKEFRNLKKVPTKSGLILKQHQVEAIDELFNGNCRQINALFVGAGKSLVATFAAKVFTQVTGCRVLAVVPPSLKDNWKRELDDIDLEAEIFSSAKIPSPDLIDGEFFVIFDESHMYQNITSQRSKRMLTLTESVKCLGLIHLTGTPMRNGQPKNLYPLLKSVKHPVARTKKEYEIRYCDLKVSYFGHWDNSGASNLHELHKKTATTIFKRNRKDCLDLPEFTRVFQDVELEPTELRTYQDNLRAAKDDYFHRLELGEIKSGGQSLVFLGYARKYSSLAKVPATIETTKEILKDGNQVIIFTWYKDVANQIATSLNCHALTGDTPQKLRQGMVDDFQNGIDKVIVCTFGAGGQGLNMQAADYLLLVDRDHVPAFYEQAEGRAWRQGRTKPVTSIWLNFTHNQVDSVIDAVILGKQRKIDLVIKGKKKKVDTSKSFEHVAQKLLAHLYDLDES